MSTKKGKPVLSGVAIAYSKEHAAQVFEGRRGHGGGNANRVLLSRAEFEDNLAIAFELGSQKNDALARVRS